MSLWIAGLVPVVLAALLGLSPRYRQPWLGPLRTLAVASAGTLVLADLLPDAWSALGGGAVAAFLVSLVVPVWTERALHRSTVFAAAAGVGLHQAMDGLQIATLGSAWGPAGVLVFAVHGAPLVLALVIGAECEGKVLSVASAALCVLATAAGIVAGTSVPADLVSGVDPWMKAVASGLLLHVLAHDLGEDLPRSAFDRALDAAVASLGVVATYCLVDPERWETVSPSTSIATAFFLVALATALWFAPLRGVLTRLTGRHAHVHSS